MAYDYSKLTGRIKEKYGSQAAFAAAMGLSERTISLKLNAVRDWKQSEIKQACKILDIADKDISSYFLKLKFNIEQRCLLRTRAGRCEEF